MSNNKYFTVVTDIGVAKISNAILLEVKLGISQMAFGDGNGSYYAPSTDMEALKNEVYRVSVTKVVRDPKNANVINILAIIPSEIGGFIIREMAVFDADGDMIAIGNTPDAPKLTLADGVSTEMEFEVKLAVSNTEVLAIEVDPTMIIATKKDLEELGRENEAYTNNVISNENLLRNPFFGQNPLGQSIYDFTGYWSNDDTVSAWKKGNRLSITVETDGIIVQGILISETNYSSMLYQELELERFLGKKIIFTLIVDGVDYSLAGTLPDALSPYAIYLDTPFGFIKIGRTDNNLIISTHFNKDLLEHKVTGAKLEIGSISTLHNDVENYNYDYLVTSLYNPVTGDFRGLPVSNENIFDNGYLGSTVINQTNFTTVTGSGQTVDRFFLYSGGVVNKKADGLELISVLDWGQRVENYRLEYNTIMTASILETDGTLSTLTFKWLDGDSIYALFVRRDGIASNFMANFIPNWSSPDRISSLFAIQNLGSTNTIKAFKLELGAVSTLRNDPPPNVALELLKCQRYLEPILSFRYLDAGIYATDFYNVNGKGLVAFAIKWSAQKRIAPSLLKIGTDGRVLIKRNNSPYAGESYTPESFSFYESSVYGVLLHMTLSVSLPNVDQITSIELDAYGSTLELYGSAQL